MSSDCTQVVLDTNWKPASEVLNAANSHSDSAAPSMAVKMAVNRWSSARAAGMMATTAAPITYTNTRAGRIGKLMDGPLAANTVVNSEDDISPPPSRT